MKYEDLKAGDVFIEKTHNSVSESMVLNVTERYMHILSYMLYDNHLFEFKIKHVYRFSENIDVELCSASHFCSIKNIYENISKYLKYKENNYLQLLGIRYRYHGNLTLSYFKSGDLYIEILSLKQQGIPFVYIKESYYFYDFDISLDGYIDNYYIPDGDGMVLPVDVTKCSSNSFQKIVPQHVLTIEEHGCSFVSSDDEHVISFVTTDKNIFNGFFSNNKNTLTDGFFFDGAGLNKCDDSDFVSEMQKMEQKFS